MEQFKQFNVEKQAALKGLPAKVQAAKPFPKSFASIQQEMHKSR